MGAYFDLFLATCLVAVVVIGISLLVYSINYGLRTLRTLPKKIIKKIRKYK